MPNHITNFLYVTGPAEDVERFRKQVSSENPVLQERYQTEIRQKIERLETKQASGEKLGPFEKTDLKEAKELRKNGIIRTLDFNGTVPMPLELEETEARFGGPKDSEQARKNEELVEKYGASNWYDWHCQNWSTKWNAYDESAPEDTEGGIRYRFDTAWSPPANWILRTAEQFPTLEIRDDWIDEGGGAGRFSVWTEDGCVQNSDEQLDDHDWNMQYNDDYREEYEFITEGDYDEVVEKYRSEREINYSDFEKPLLDRLKDKDLPLFIDFEWWHGDLYEKRLKGV